MQLKDEEKIKQKPTEAREKMLESRKNQVKAPLQTSLNKIV